MTIKILNEEDYIRSKWSGGTTEQIYIYPEASSIGELNFEYRISSAKVDIEESDFTKMLGYNRIIMSLDNEIELNHWGEEGEIEDIRLKPYKEHRFLGEYKTTCKGSCQDFNFIYRDGYEGELSVIKNNEKIKLSPEYNYLFYSLVDNVKILLDKESIVLRKNESALIQGRKTSLKFIKDREEDLNLFALCKFRKL